MSVELLSFEAAEPLLDWLALTRALAAGHRLPKAEIGDTFLYRGKDTLLSRSAWIDGMGIAVKSATIFPDNAKRGMPMVNGGASLYSDTTGALEAIIDFRLVTKWKTAADSLLAALRLARADAARILVVGAGTVGRSVIEAFGAGFPTATFTLWNRTRASAEQLAHEFPDMALADDLESAARIADIIVTATMARDPVIRGAWLKPGAHLNLIGAYRADMREADDEALRGARVFVDSRDTTLDHIGELKDPLARGVIARDDIIADFYDLESGRFARKSREEITLFKNGGGAHLDLMTCRYILEAWRER